MEKQQLEETAAFIREHRGSESNFPALCAKLEEVIGMAEGEYKNRLVEVKEKKATEYSTAQKNGTAAWPEFEKFASEFEKAVTGELHGHN